ncbi:MAG: MFS transporter, partial [Dehalococcoidia bacterium]|nr:MFS transporter [Dehalococcoidia bacterium]MXY88245.1 MFS transporter [Dehalococcoidia bacterium]
MTTSVSSEPVLGVLLSEREKMLLLLALGMCMFLSSLDGSILATALPTISSDLDGFK